ncbi:uncharacterized protein LOC115887689 [Sitophilus oryzae]|uniref:Uncharacterized protein LOC115887689 n=1 Tax=Sitophilus oryzae TaxID=7048 RepID=A0A6J2YHX3_SITOR|nr:uncharacterized protein LOC115887689 [Sitophilus oryzae]
MVICLYYRLIMLPSDVGKLWTLSLFITIVPSTFQTASCQINNSTWVEMRRITGLFLHQCLLNDIKKNTTENENNIGLIFKECLKQKGLNVLDRVLNRDVIEITKSIVLVRRNNENETSNHTEWHSNSINDKSLRSFHSNDDWKTAFLERIGLFIKSRVLKIRLKAFNIASEWEGRHRRKDNMMSQLMMFGLVAAGFIVIPLGFQFLAVLGGKALLLAKLALLLSSINGLKKIATSHMNYGLYHAGHHGAPCKSYYDCKSLSDYDHYSLETPHSQHDSSYSPYGYFGLTGEGVDYDETTDDDDDDILFSVDIDTDPTVVSGHYDRQWLADTDSHPDVHEYSTSGIGHSPSHASIFPRQDD